jgi:hypothetical protein
MQQSLMLTQPKQGGTRGKASGLFPGFHQSLHSTWATKLQHSTFKKNDGTEWIWDPNKPGNYLGEFWDLSSLTEWIWDPDKPGNYLGEFWDLSALTNTDEPGMYPCTQTFIQLKQRCKGSIEDTFQSKPCTRYNSQHKHDKKLQTANKQLKMMLRVSCRGWPPCSKSEAESQRHQMSTWAYTKMCKRMCTHTYANNNTHTYTQSCKCTEYARRHIKISGGYKELTTKVLPMY